MLSKEQKPTTKSVGSNIFFFPSSYKQFQVFKNWKFEI